MICIFFDFHAGGVAWTAPADAPPQASPRVMALAFKQVLDTYRRFLPPKLSAKLKVDGDSALNPAVKQQLFMWNWRASLDRARPKTSSKHWKAF